MILTFDARIVGAEIHCEIGSDMAISGATLCCSLFVPSRVVSGGTLLRTVAGYTEVALPDIPEGGLVPVVFTQVNEGFIPKSRAWLPLGAYLRLKTGVVALPALETGVRVDTPPPRTVPDFAALRLVPQPTEWRPSVGVLQVGGFVDGPAAVDALAIRLGFAPFVQPGGVRLTSRRVEMAEGAYELTIATDGVEVVSMGDLGLHSACITLMNLREIYSGAMPCGRIVDAPRFGYRGQHLDCARHFYEVRTILRLLDLMALLKLNRFHWHFSDDEAFRLEVSCAPELWQKTAMRGEGCVVPGVYGGGIRAGGHYSKADVALILDRAAELQIEVLPEIEVPAHGYCMNVARAGMRDPEDNSLAISVHGYHDNTINPALPDTWALIEPLALEVAGMFRMGVLHLGCDELPPDAWSASPAIERLKVQQGLETRDDVQGWMMARLAGFLAANGVRSAAWEEAAKGSNGGIGSGALLFSWTGQGPGVEAARRGYDVVMCPAQSVYFDMMHTTSVEDWGTCWAIPEVPLEQVVNWRPVPVGAEDVADRIVGVEGCFWSEFTTKDQEMEPMLAPRILGLANKGWDIRDSLDGSGLRALAQAYGPVFDRMGWQRHKGA
jgi:hexosaminidase